MNSIEFLISLKDINNYLYTIHPDLEMLIQYFSPTMFNESFSKFPFQGETFLSQVEKDIQNANEEQIFLLADFIQKYFKSYTNKYPLLNILRKGILDYLMNHPNSFVLKDYYPILADAVIDRIQQDLQYPIAIFNLEHEPGDAKTYFDGTMHHLGISKPSVLMSNTKNIYELFDMLYHEQYHMIVGELEENPECFKVNILQFAITKAFQNCLHNPKIENYYYADLKEENNAYLYGLKKAKEEILKINPNFKVYSPWKKFEESYFQSGSAHEYIKSTQESQSDFFEKYVDRMLLKHPEENKGILRKIYNENGSKKDFHTLLKEFNDSLKQFPSDLHADIKHFYSYALFRSLRKMPENELLSILNNSLYTNTLFSCLTDQKNQLQVQLEQLDSFHLYALSCKYKRNLTQKFIQQDLEKIESMRNYLSKKENQEYERK